jgi:exodeoxyribonuclease-1
MFPRDRNCIAPIVALAPHPHNGNAIIVADLGKDVTPLIEWDADRIREALFTRDSGEERPGLKEVRMNRCPFVAPLSVLRIEDQKRLSIDMHRAAEQLDRMRSCSGLVEKIQRVYLQERPREPKSTDVDARLYDGFWGDADRARCVRARKALREGQDPRGWEFEDARIPELIQRIRWRMSVFDSEEDRKEWLRFVGEKIQAKDVGHVTEPAFRGALNLSGGSVDDRMRSALAEHLVRTLQEVFGS